MAEEKIEAKVTPETEPAKEAPKPQEESAEVLKLKAALSKANSEAAEFKRQLRERQTEEERKESERAEAAKKLQDELAEYRKRERIASYKSKLMEAGVTPEIASTMANALPDGVGDEFFAMTKQYVEKQKQDVMAEALNAQPKLSVGTPPTSQSAAEAEKAQMRKWIGL